MFFLSINSWQFSRLIWWNKKHPRIFNSFEYLLKQKNIYYTYIELMIGMMKCCIRKWRRKQCMRWYTARFDINTPQIVYKYYMFKQSRTPLSPNNVDLFDRSFSSLTQLKIVIFGCGWLVSYMYCYNNKIVKSTNIETGFYRSNRQLNKDFRKQKIIHYHRISLNIKLHMTDQPQATYIYWMNHTKRSSLYFTHVAV